MSRWSPISSIGGHPLEGGERRRSRHDQHERVVEQLDATERALGKRQHAEREVELARLHHVHEALVGHGFRELHIHAGHARRTVR